MGLVEKGFSEQYAAMKQGERPSLIFALDRAIRLRQIGPQMACRVIEWVREDREETEEPVVPALSEPATLQVVIGSEELGSDFINYGVEEAA